MRNSCRRSVVFGIVLATLAAGTQLAQAAFTINLSQSGGDVFAAGTGSINTSALTINLNAASDSAEIYTGFSFGSLVILGSPADTTVELDTGISGPTNFGTSGGATDSFLGTGSTLGIIANDGLYLPNNYVSGTTLSGTAEWDGTTFAGLGITPGSYKWTWGSGGTADSFTINVPEPASMGLLAMACVAVYRRPRRAAAQA